jgi:hypothetical protein
MPSQEDFVLDCSITMAWCFDDEATPYTDGVRDSLADKRAVVPSIWPLEAANATITGERRKRLDEARSQRFFVLLAALPIVVDDETSSRAFSDIAFFARGGVDEAFRSCCEGNRISDRDPRLLERRTSETTSSLPDRFSRRGLRAIAAPRSRVARLPCRAAGRGDLQAAAPGARWPG